STLPADLRERPGISYVMRCRCPRDGHSTTTGFPDTTGSIMIANASQRSRLLDGAGGGAGTLDVGQIFAPAFAQSSRNFFRPMSVSGCLMSASRTANGIVHTCGPALAASITCNGLRMEAASTCVANP